ncbi:MAG TPA: hypothetical protein VKM55_22160 [Candidatus Lokiarchaeia archaeon]|nr:hypothetical protein [Candidatus Lokiarchaeia archaeon]
MDGAGGSGRAAAGVFLDLEWVGEGWIGSGEPGGERRAGRVFF